MSSTPSEEQIVFTPEAGASEEARRGFLRGLAIAAGATALAPLITRGWGITQMLHAQDLSGESEPGLSDTDILNYALTLEYLEATFYLRADCEAPLPQGLTVEEIVARIDPDGMGQPGAAQGLGEVRAPAPANFDVVDFNRTVRDHEIIHVFALQDALGDMALKREDFEFSFPGAYDDAATYLMTAQALEDTGVSAYLGQAGNIDDLAALGPAGAILGVEAEHAATFRLLNGNPVVPDNGNFDDGRTTSEVLEIAGPFITAAPELPFPAS